MSKNRVAKASALDDGSLSLLDQSMSYIEGNSIDGDSLDLNFGASGERQAQGYEDHFPSRPTTDKQDKLDQSVRFDILTDEVLDVYRKRGLEGSATSAFLDMDDEDVEDDLELDTPDDARGRGGNRGGKKVSDRDRGREREERQNVVRGEKGFGESKSFQSPPKSHTQAHSNNQGNNQGNTGNAPNNSGLFKVSVDGDNKVGLNILSFTLF